MPSAVDIETLDEVVAKGGHRFKFPAALETFYTSQTDARRLKTMRASTLPIVFFYNVCLLEDLFLVSDRFTVAVIIHLFIVTPLLIAASNLYGRVANAVVNEVLAALVPIAMVAQIIYVYVFSKSPLADHYQYMALLILLYANINQRLGYSYTKRMSFCVAGLYAAGLAFGPSDLQVKFAAVSILCVVQWATLLASKRMDESSRYNFLVHLRDTLRREEAEREANQDALTGLYNRRFLDERIVSPWNRGDLGTNLTCIVALDIDNFKLYNDFYGHPAGDECLRQIAEVVRRFTSDTQAYGFRIGGEEFLLVGLGCSNDDAWRLAENVRRAVTQLRIAHEGVGINQTVSVSVGLAAGERGEIRMEDLIAKADLALYKAKRSGRNRICGGTEPLPEIAVQISAA